MEKALIETLDLNRIVDKLFGSRKEVKVTNSLFTSQFAILGKVCGGLTFLVFDMTDNWFYVVRNTAPDNLFDWECRVTAACKPTDSQSFKTIETEVSMNGKPCGYKYEYFRM